MELTRITPDATALRALSHPTRLRILGLLRSDGPTTATALATRLGLNSGATSYHLRQLAAHGFVEDDPGNGGGAGNGRDRWWRAAHQSTHYHETLDTPRDEREAADAFGQAVAVVHTEQLQRAVEERTLLPSVWRQASSFNDWGIRLTPERAAELTTAIVQLIEGWTEDEPDTPGAVEYVLIMNGFPRPGRVTQADPSSGPP